MSNASTRETESFFWALGYLKRPLDNKMPRFNPTRHFLYGLLKGKVCTIKPCTIDDLKGNIQQEIAAIPMHMLQSVFAYMEHGVQLCKGTHLCDRD
jgi:hypothetical protein